MSNVGFAIGTAIYFVVEHYAGSTRSSKFYEGVAHVFGTFVIFLLIKFFSALIVGTFVIFLLIKFFSVFIGGQQ